MKTYEIRIPEVEHAASRRAARKGMMFALPWFAVFVASGLSLWAFAA